MTEKIGGDVRLRGAGFRKSSHTVPEAAQGARRVRREER
jgi:hypothetical protein